MPETHLPSLGAYASILVSLVTIVPIEHDRPVGPGVKMTFELTSKQGAALITNHPTYREDIERERERHFEIYTKKHFDSWVDFAREIGHGEDIKPVLVTGVDLTKEFSSIAYSDNRTHMECEFSVGAPAVGSASMPAWGSWSTPGLVHTNCGPTQGSAQRYRGTDESPFSGPVSVIPEDHNQCVFIRYYTIRKKLSIPLLLEAWAGSHQLPEENVEEGDAEVTVVEISDDGDEEIGYLIEAGSNVIHNVPLVSPERHPRFPLLMESIRMTGTASMSLQSSYFKLELPPGTVNLDRNLNRDPTRPQYYCIIATSKTSLRCAFASVFMQVSDSDSGE